MAKLWTANKTWVSDSPNANTEYLVGATNGGCNYQSIPQGGTKRILVSNGANGNVAYGNRSVPLPEGYGNMEIPNIQISDLYIPNWSGTGTCIRIYTPLSINNTAKRYETTQSDYRNESGPNYKLQFRIESGSSEGDISTFNNFLSQMKKIELWFKYQTDKQFYKWSIVELDPSKWLHSSDYAWAMDSDYYTSTKGDFPGGTGNVVDTGITAYIVPFK